jgi:hypothetical protein
VARGLLWVTDHCTDESDRVSGYAAAWGNGEIMIQARLVCTFDSHCNSRQLMDDALSEENALGAVEIVEEYN